MMRRPDITDDMIEHALEIAADAMSADFETLQGVYVYPTDGFELALKLHSEFGWDMERDDLDYLDAIDVNVERQHKALCKKWFAENNIQPPFPVGTEIIEGVITGIYEYDVAIYEVKEHGCQDKSRRLLIKFEDARLPETDTQNVISQEQQAQLISAFESEEWMFGHQAGWHKAGTYRLRNILTTRFSGATMYFALEAFIDALKTGHNQIFLAAGEHQSDIFRQHIAQFAKDVANINLKGDSIALQNGAMLYFFDPTTFTTASALSGNVYIADYFWNGKFKRFRKIAAGIACLKRFRQTYWSSLAELSPLTNDAYHFWLGYEIDTSHAALVNGMLCADRQWRQIVTIDDCIKDKNYSLANIEQMRQELGTNHFNQQFMCQFTDDVQTTAAANLGQGGAA